MNSLVSVRPHRSDGSDDYRERRSKQFIVSALVGERPKKTTCQNAQGSIISSCTHTQGINSAMSFNLKTAVGSRKSAQPLDAPRKCKN